MFTKTAIALVLIVSTASGVLAQKRSTNTQHDVFSITGKYVGSDPDANIRFMLQHDHGVE